MAIYQNREIIFLKCSAIVIDILIYMQLSINYFTDNLTIPVVHRMLKTVNAKDTG